MESVSVFLDNQYLAISGNNDVSRTQGMCHVIHIDFGSSLSKILLCLPGFIIIRYV